MKNKYLILLIVTIILTGCQPTPKQEAIQKKEDIDIVVEKKEETEQKEGTIAEQYNIPEHETFEVVSASGKLKYYVDAAVKVPMVNKIPAVKVERYDYKEDELKEITKFFFGDNPVYKPRDFSQYSKNELLEQIATFEAQKEEVSALGGEKWREQNYETAIRALQDKLKDAPDEPVYEDVSYSFGNYKDEEYHFEAAITRDGVEENLSILQRPDCSSLDYYINGNGFVQESYESVSDRSEERRVGKEC